MRRRLGRRQRAAKLQCRPRFFCHDTCVFADHAVIEGMVRRREGRAGRADAAGLPGLRRAARRFMHHERQGPCRLRRSSMSLPVAGPRHEVTWRDPAHFFAVSAELMRRILVDAARARTAVKRGGRAERVSHSSAFDFDNVPDVSSVRDRELIVIDDALDAWPESIRARPAHRIALFRRVERRRDRRGIERLASDGHARLEAGQGLDDAGAQQRVMVDVQR